MSNPSNSEVSKIVNDQQADDISSGAFSFAKLNKGGYFKKNGILFHRIKILDNVVKRLVVPKGRRQALLELAVDQAGCHSGIRRTKERIGLSFTWPSLNKDVVE